MYYRIQNRLDARLLLADMRKRGQDVPIGDRILELAGTLDDAYGKDRKSTGMGGYILYFPDSETYENTIVEVWDFYHIEPREFEYQEYIGDTELNDVKWIEKLFLLSSDDSLVLVYPQKENDFISMIKYYENPID
jgi:hypothetical protein